jgi:hypothetical protein
LSSFLQAVTVNIERAIIPIRIFFINAFYLEQKYPNKANHKLKSLAFS